VFRRVEVEIFSLDFEDAHIRADRPREQLQHPKDDLLVHKGHHDKS
jgi:hypothetical protein